MRFLAYIQAFFWGSDTFSGIRVCSQTPRFSYGMSKSVICACSRGPVAGRCMLIAGLGCLAVPTGGYTGWVYRWAIPGTTQSPPSSPLLVLPGPNQWSIEAKYGQMRLNMVKCGQFWSYEAISGNLRLIPTAPNPWPIPCQKGVDIWPKCMEYGRKA